MREIVDQNWLDRRGGLNDAYITDWKSVRGALYLCVDDAWANFEGLADYSGPAPGVLEVITDNVPIISKEILTEKLSEVRLVSRGALLNQLEIVCYGGYSINIACSEIRWSSDGSISDIMEQ